VLEVINQMTLLGGFARRRSQSKNCIAILLQSILADATIVSPPLGHPPIMMVLYYLYAKLQEIEL